MKLNLLPTSVSKEGQQKTAMIVSVLLAALGIIGCVFMIITSKKQLDDAKAKAEEIRPQAEEALRIAQEADTIIQSGTGIQRNSMLASSMLAHNSVYPNLYREVLGYVPSFFRLTSITAAPVSDTQCSVTMTGVIQTYEQYANIMLALLRIPTATNVTRSGYQNIDKFVPGLDSQDQVGILIRPGQARVPSNPLERLDQMIADNASGDAGFLNVSGFGSNDPGAKGPMPDWSQITVTVTLTSGEVDGKQISRDIRTPDPRATLAQQTGGAPAQTPAGGGGTAPTPAPGPTGPSKGRAAPGGRPEDE